MVESRRADHQLQELPMLTHNALAAIRLTWSHPTTIPIRLTEAQ